MDIKTATVEYGLHITKHDCSSVSTQIHVPVIIHDRDGEADLLHILRRDVKNNGLIVHRV